MELLAAKDVRKTYRLGKVDVPVLRGASVSVAKGEWVAVLGASGSGKSTLLHLMGGLDRADKGTDTRCARCKYDVTGTPGDTCPECGGPLRREGGDISFKGLALRQLTSAQLDRYRAADVGFVFQFYHLLPELTVLENTLSAAMVLHGRFAYSSKQAELARRATELLASFGLSHRLGHRSAELSGGERQRVAIARALMNGPMLLLADEPTGNLDRATGDKIMDEIARHRRETGQTIVMVTHDAEVAARADRVVHLRDGRVVDGPG